MSTTPADERAYYLHLLIFKLTGSTIQPDTTAGARAQHYQIAKGAARLERLEREVATMAVEDAKRAYSRLSKLVLADDEALGLLRSEGGR